MVKIWRKSIFFLEKLDKIRDEVLFIFIKPYWPRAITPNFLTATRIAIGLVLFVLLFYYKNNNGAIILSLFFIGAFTDLLDGSVARGLNMETKVGETFDPIADRILIIPIAFYSLFGSHKWLFLLLVFLEIINGLMSLYAQSKTVAIKSNIYGKTKMVLQSIVFMGILIIWPKNPGIFLISALWLSMVLMLMSIILKFTEIKTLLRKYDANPQMKC